MPVPSPAAPRPFSNVKSRFWQRGQLLPPPTPSPQHSVTQERVGWVCP